MKKPGRNSKREIASRNLKAINREEFKSDITRALQTSDMQADTLNAILRETLVNHAPLVTRAVRSCRNAPWFNTQVKEAKRERRAAERKWNKTGLHVHREMFISARNRFNNVVCSVKRQHYLSKLSSAGSCKELFWVTDELLGKTSGSPSTTQDQGPSSFLNFFTSKVCKVRENLIGSNGDVQHPSYFKPVSEDEVKDILKNSPLKTCELDPVPSTVLKEIFDVVLPSITTIINSSLQSAKHRIDMAHGFMKSVIRNQIDRDNYDKEVKAQQRQDKRNVRPQSSKPKKPELQTYVPPQRSKKGSIALL
ncbi:RNA-directed DNA polymerase from mobile element jockey [Elysia marginata]|uniref:RNA-directed DNA polymerase from mobile element jockey n=1 Tax=Elysia marginata TaxID=1093978 RepID=A0AAV4JR03_9GAST|nr:RNA-directed DNA polymerase from mobile element jockey [Elysia marginata]